MHDAYGVALRMPCGTIKLPYTLSTVFGHCPPHTHFKLYDNLVRPSEKIINVKLVG